MQNRHAAYQTPPSVLAALLRRAVGQGTAFLLPVVRGYDNEVYAARMEDGAEYMVRIRRHGNASFADEAWAIEQCRAAGAPVPEILLLDHVVEAEMVRDAMVQRRLPGVPLSDVLPSLADAERACIFAQVGEALARIHSVRAGGFYKRHGDGSWDFDTWEAIGQSALRERAKERPELLHCGFTNEDCDAILRWIEQTTREFPCPQPVLCHGDLHPAHLIVTDDLKLSGVIDFGEFQGGPPILDMALLSMDAPEINLRWLADGYADPVLFDDSFARHLALCKVGLQAGYLAYYVQSGMTEEAALATQQMHRTLAECRALT